MDHTSRRVPSVLGALSAAALLLGSTPGQAQPLFDHLKCVSVQDSLTVKAKVDLEALRTDFGLEQGCRISKTAFLCTPVAKTVVESNLPPIPGASGDPLSSDMVCYKAQCPGDATPPPTQNRGDQFGTHELRVRKTRWLCLPSGTNCTPNAEVCDGLDNDCDGTADDLPPITCGVGACENTVAACISGVPQTCTPGTPGAETCNGDDDDCDGAVDEDIADLVCGVGECRVTVPACVSGTPQTCTPGTPSPWKSATRRTTTATGRSTRASAVPRSAASASAGRRCRADASMACHRPANRFRQLPSAATTARTTTAICSPTSVAASATRDWRIASTRATGARRTC